MSVPFLLFSGFFVSFDAIPVYLRWITYLSYIRYGFEGTAIATYGYNRSLLKCNQVRTKFILKTFHFHYFFFFFLSKSLSKYFEFSFCTALLPLQEASFHTSRIGYGGF